MEQEPGNEIVAGHEEFDKDVVNQLAAVRADLELEIDSHPAHTNPDRNRVLREIASHLDNAISSAEALPENPPLSK